MGITERNGGYSLFLPKLKELVLQRETASCRALLENVVALNRGPFDKMALAAWQGSSPDYPWMAPCLRASALEEAFNSSFILEQIEDNSTGEYRYQRDPNIQLCVSLPPELSFPELKVDLGYLLPREIICGAGMILKAKPYFRSSDNPVLRDSHGYRFRQRQSQGSRVVCRHYDQEEEGAWQFSIEKFLRGEKISGWISPRDSSMKSDNKPLLIPDGAHGIAGYLLPLLPELREGEWVTGEVAIKQEYR